MRFACVLIMLCAFSPVVAIGQLCAPEGFFDFKAAVEKEADTQLIEMWRRDPFTVVVVESDPELQKKKEREQKSEEKEIFGTLQSYLINAAEAFKNGDLKTTLSLCQQGLSLLPAKPAEAIAIGGGGAHEGFLRLQLAAERLQERRAADRAFLALRPKLTGVLAATRRSNAIIGGKSIRIGEFLPLNDAQEVVYIEDIRADGVILRFRGFRMELGILQPH